jgi:hypothetical protein
MSGIKTETEDQRRFLPFKTMYGKITQAVRGESIQRPEKNRVD